MIILSLPAKAQQLDKPDTVQTFVVGSGPNFLAFDGANVWVTHHWDSTVTKLRASDGAPQGTFGAGANPSWITFDGTNVWASNLFGDNLTKLRASDGAVLGTYSVGDAPEGLAWPRRQAR